jgi:DNA polymerase IV
MLVVPSSDVVAFVHQLPVGALWGVGERTEEALQRLGLRTVADLAHTPRPTLQRALGDAAGAHLHELAWGRDPRRVEPLREEKSVGADETFPYDVDDPGYVRRELLRLSDKVSQRLRAAGLSGRTITLKVRFADFTTITRARTLREPTDVSREILAAAIGLYEALGLQRARIRLVGVRVSSIVDSARAPIQGVLGEPEHGWRDADRAVDRAQARFGRGIVTSAALLTSHDPHFPRRSHTT